MHIGRIYSSVGAFLTKQLLSFLMFGIYVPFQVDWVISFIVATLKFTGMCSFAIVHTDNMGIQASLSLKILATHITDTQLVHTFHVENYRTFGWALEWTTWLNAVKFSCLIFGNMWISLMSF